MLDYILFMHDDAPPAARTPGEDRFGPYIQQLKASGCFQGGSAIGSGRCFKKSDPVPSVSAHIVGFIRIQARDIEHAREFVAGNPVFEAGGTVEIRELPRT